jgi:ribosome biogenesis GTPase
MDLHEIGWDETHRRHFEACGEAGTVPGRVARVDRASYRLMCETGELTAVLAGRLADGEGTLLPVVGDWCALAPPQQAGPGVVRAVLPRRTVFSRRAAGRATAEQVLAANIDLAFLVTGLDADYSLRRIERLLALAWESGAEPVVVLNKADLCDEVPARLAEVGRIAPGATTVALSAATGEGLAQLRALVARGRTIAFLGSSGVGKSTLVNHLLGTERMATRAVRARDGRGVHTTTHSELIVLPEGGVLVDSPGLREVGMWVGEEALAATFTEIAELAGACRFTDCTHRTEPGCAVRAAVESGQLDGERLASFHKLQREAASAARRADEHTRRQYEKKTYGSYRRWLKEKRRLEGEGR